MMNFIYFLSEIEPCDRGYLPNFRSKACQGILLSVHIKNYCAMVFNFFVKRENANAKLQNLTLSYAFLIRHR